VNRLSVSAIVLAGGRSSRFGRDKLAETVGGRTLLDHALDAVVPLAAEVIVVRRPGDDAPAPAGTRVIHDPVAFEGPLVALRSALGQAIHETVLVVAGDMPEPSRAVLALLIGELDDPTVEAVQLRDADRPRPLPLAVRREPARSAVDRLVSAGERRLRALPAALRTLVIDETTWRPLDPDGRTLRDVDTPADLPKE
jgi:molybdopterin-guanine dinucleotide biosynthesis protein A